MSEALRAFVGDHTRPLTVPLCPELELHCTDAFTSLWQLHAGELEQLGLDTPFWAVPWAGGQALARFVLDHPQHVVGRTVLDLGCGSGIVALAAARAGAHRVLANDPDPLAMTATAINAQRNAAAIELLAGDLLERAPPSEVELVLAADLWFDSALASRVTRWLRQRRLDGIEVLIGDPWRAYLPRRGVELLAEYAVPTSTELERHAITCSGVWRMR